MKLKIIYIFYDAPLAAKDVPSGIRGLVNDGVGWLLRPNGVSI